MALTSQPLQPKDLPHQLLALVDRQTWLDEPSERVQQAIQAAYDRAGPAGQRVEDALHGTWLGHALHPVLTDVPLGAWLMGGLFDLLDALGWRRFRLAADVALTVGLGGAAAAAASGLTDWQHLPGKSRRVGALHALLNTAASVCYLGSWVLRKNRRRAAGRNLAWAGLLITFGSAYLGGDLVARQVGVDHTADLRLPEDFTSVLPLDRLVEGQLHRAEAGGTPVLLLKRGDRLFALAETCAHLGGPLAEGDVDGESVICPWHGSRFALEDGRVLNGPSAYPQPCFETRVLNGLVQVRLARRSGHEA